MPITARTAISCSAVVTNAVARLATPSRTSPMSITRRRPNRSATVPPSAVLDDHRARLERLFDALRGGVARRP